MARPRVAPVHEVGPVRVSERGSGFRIRWVEGGSEHERSRSSFVDAAMFADEIAERMALVTEGAIGGTVAFGALMEAWVERHQEDWSTGHTQNTVSLIVNHISPAVGSTPCDSLTDSDLVSVVRSMAAAGYSKDWVSKVHNILRAVCRWGTQRGVWLPHRNPAVNLSTGTVAVDLVPRKLIPTAAQVAEVRAAVAASAGSEDTALRREWMVAAGAGCGLRWGEVLGVCPPAVDLATRRVSVNRAWHKLDRCFGAPKSAHSVRTVVIPEADLALWRKAVLATAPGECLARTEKGRVWATSNWNTLVWGPARASVSWPKGATFHSLRHHAIVSWLGKGLPIGDVSALAGHHSAAFTMARYVGPGDDYLDRAAAAL